jgi:hypothetical protein
VLDVFRYPTVRLLAGLLRDGATETPADDTEARRAGRARLARARTARVTT